MISVCMATYNGDKYIKEQISSILKNLSSNDELVISDDGSTDNTLKIVKRFKNNDKRIRLIQGPKKGFVKNFENAIKNSRGEYIFLSDQDDVWKDNKVKEVMKCFEDPKTTLVVHDCQVINEHGKVLEPSFFSLRDSRSGLIHNLIKNSYIGCCMAFRRKILRIALPIPSNIPWHDEWIGLINDAFFTKATFVSKILFSYRRHDNNVSKMKHSSIRNIIKMRYVYIYELLRRRSEVDDK